MQIDDSAASCRAYSRHDKGIIPIKLLTQEHLKQLMRSFYYMEAVITKEKWSSLPEIKLTMNNGGFKEGKG